jgi:maltooligosyltrehalose trehalohydrolase
MAIGAEIQLDGSVHFRTWAPACESVEIVVRGESFRLAPEDSGYFSGAIACLEAGCEYRLRLDDGRWEGPDPASRFQPSGPLGPSMIVAPQSFRWTDNNWPGLTPQRQVLYEMHVGTFTGAGTWQAAARELPHLAELGITAIELMPITEFPGKFGWSYDGSQLYAPYHRYGMPDDFRHFVDTAHGAGIGVLIDVVYNHLGMVGERLLRSLSDHYFSERHTTDWGAALNYDGVHAQQVREFILENVRYWIREFHVDGYRIDATQSIFDESERHILLDINRTARAAAGKRGALLIAENEPQQARLMRRAEAGGYEFDCAWNDDFHHSAMVRLTGRNEAYYSDYRGTSDEFVASAKWGYLYQGQRYSWQKNVRGAPALDLESWQFVNYLQNHDQIANSATGERVNRLTSPGRLRTMTAVLLLGPQTPLLFQGQEFAASGPFFYFNDCGQPQADSVRAGRAEFLSQFRSLATEQMQAFLPDPCDAENFRACALDHGERLANEPIWCLHRDLIRLRKHDAVISRQLAGEIEAAAFDEDAYALRYLPPNGHTRLLLVNFGRAMVRPFLAHPLLAPPAGSRWNVLWSSDDPAYGGSGTPNVDTDEGWYIPGEAAVLLHPVAPEDLS